MHSKIDARLSYNLFYNEDNRRSKREATSYTVCRLGDRSISANASPLLLLPPPPPLPNPHLSILLALFTRLVRFAAIVA